MRLDCVIYPLHPRTIFRISRAARTEVRNVFIRIERDGIVGYGEASPNAFYGETAEVVAEKLKAVEAWLRTKKVDAVSDIERAWNDAWPLLAPSRAAQCALDIALWDLAAKSKHTTVAELALAHPPQAIASFCTIGVSDAEELRAKVAELAQNPLIKVKSDARADLAPIEFIRASTPAKIAVDANCAWSGLDLGGLARRLAELGVIFIEQPLPPRQVQAPGASSLPIFADESCVTLEDVDGLPAQNFSGFNIKLVKCGGLTPALKMLGRGRELGLRVMVGCMLESSLLISAGAVIGQRSDYADLDGAWLLRDDPFSGLSFDKGILTPSSALGFGVWPREGVHLFRACTIGN